MRLSNEALQESGELPSTKRYYRYIGSVPTVCTEKQSNRSIPSKAQKHGPAKPGHVIDHRHMNAMTRHEAFKQVPFQMLPPMIVASTANGWDQKPSRSHMSFANKSRTYASTLTAGLLVESSSGSSAWTGMRSAKFEEICFRCFASKLHSNNKCVKQQSAHFDAPQHTTHFLVCLGI